MHYRCVIGQYHGLWEVGTGIDKARLATTNDYYSWMMNMVIYCTTPPSLCTCELFHNQVFKWNLLFINDKCLWLIIQKNDTLLNLHRSQLLKGKKFSNSINRFHLYDWIKGDSFFCFFIHFCIFNTNLHFFNNQGQNR